MKLKDLTKAQKQLLDVPTLTVQEIADKHNVSVKDIEKQLKMGIEVEKEHSTIPEVQREIALDHLKELPDYYTRLKAMEKEGEEALK